MISVSTRGQQTVLRRIQSASPAVRLRLHIALEFIGSELVALMKSRSSSLKEKSGRLERSFFTRVNVRDGGNVFVLRTGLTRRAFYGAFQDKGVNPKTVDVKGYARGVRGRNVKEGRRRIASGIGFVQAYRRQMHLGRVPFIGSSLEEMRSAIVKELQIAVGGGLGGP